MILKLKELFGYIIRKTQFKKINKVIMFFKIIIIEYDVKK